MCVSSWQENNKTEVTDSAAHPILSIDKRVGMHISDSERRSGSIKSRDPYMAVYRFLRVELSKSFIPKITSGRH